MPQRPDLVVFDVNETLSDLSTLADRFVEVGAPAHLAATWFAALLRDGFALTVTGANPAFAGVGRGVLRGLLASHVPDEGQDAAVATVMAAFGELGVHPDVVPGVRALRRAGHRLATLTNGAAAVPDGLLTRTRIRDQFERLMSVEDAGAWKPARRAYEFAAQQCGVPIGDALLVAVHPWDIHGAKVAGMRAAWIKRDAAPYPAHFVAPDVVATGVDDLAEQLAAAGG
jgi:2-haloacid dehalogenase